MKKRLTTAQIGALVLAALTAGGCCHSINVTASDDICKKSVEVHLVGVSSIEKTTWETMSMTDYWKPANPLQKSAEPYTEKIFFGLGRPCDQNVPANTDIQAIWKANHAKYLFVLAHLPGTFSDLPADADLRRLVVPSPCSKSWLGPEQINIRIESGNVRCLSEFK